MYTNSNRHRMTEIKNTSLKEGDNVSYKVGNDMIAHGKIFHVLEDNRIIVQIGNGGRGLEYVALSQIVKHLA